MKASVLRPALIQCRILQLFVIFLRQLQVRKDDHFQGCHNCDPGKSQAIELL
jgi:hypothetical protein